MGAHLPDIIAALAGTGAVAMRPADMAAGAAFHPVAAADLDDARYAAGHAHTELDRQPAGPSAKHELCDRCNC